MSTLIAALLVLATLFMLVGLARKARQYRATPAPLKIPVTPAPKTTIPCFTGSGFYPPPALHH